MWSAPVSASATCSAGAASCGAGAGSVCAGTVRSGAGSGRSPGVLAELLSVAGLPMPTTFTLFPVTLTGTCTGSCTPLPDSRPGEPCASPSAEAPDAPDVPDVSDAPFGEPEAPCDASSCRASSLTQVLPAAGLRRPTTFTVFPHTLTGTCTGS